MADISPSRVAPLAEDDPLLVWTATLDNRFTVQAIRVGNDGYNGEVVIWDGDKEIARQSTTFQYQARYGPDVEDVGGWRDWAVGIIDAQD